MPASNTIASKRLSELAIARVAQLFQIPLGDVRENMLLDDLPNPRYSSYPLKTAMDFISEDIGDMASLSIAKRLKSGEIVIHTVGDYVG